LDFFDLSGFASLLTQARSMAFTPEGVQRLLEGTGLEFPGFELPDRRIYQAFYQRNSEAD